MTMYVHNFNVVFIKFMVNWPGCMDIPAYLIHSSSKHPIGKAVGTLRYTGKQFNQIILLLSAIWVYRYNTYM